MLHGVEKGSEALQKRKKECGQGRASEDFQGVCTLRGSATRYHKVPAWVAVAGNIR